MKVEEGAKTPVTKVGEEVGWNWKLEKGGEGVREDTHKKSVFLVVGPLRFYPPYTNGLVVHATFFF